jgi:hypothetical protein
MRKKRPREASTIAYLFGELETAYRFAAAGCNRHLGLNAIVLISDAEMDRL